MTASLPPKPKHTCTHTQRNTQHEHTSTVSCRRQPTTVRSKQGTHKRVSRPPRLALLLLGCRRERRTRHAGRHSAVGCLALRCWVRSVAVGVAVAIRRHGGCRPSTIRRRRTAGMGCPHSWLVGAARRWRRTSSHAARGTHRACRRWYGAHGGISAVSGAAGGWVPHGSIRVRRHRWLCSSTVRGFALAAGRQWWSSVAGCVVAQADVVEGRVVHSRRAWVRSPSSKVRHGCTVCRPC